MLTILTGYVARLVRSSALSPIDRTLGFIFGLARGAFLVCLAYLVLDISCSRTIARLGSRKQRASGFSQRARAMLRRFLPESLQVKNAAVADEVIHALEPAQEAQKAMRAL